MGLTVVYLRRGRPKAAAATAAAPAASASAAAQSAAAPAAAPQAAATPTDDARAEQARQCKERGNKRFAGKQYAKAISEYTQAIALADDENDPEVAKYYGNRAQCHACLEQHAEAESDCDAALRLDPKYVKALVRRANAREKLGRPEQAMVDFTGALLLSDMQHDAATQGVDRLVREVASAKAEQRLKVPMRCLPSPFFISTFVDSFKPHRELLAVRAHGMLEQAPRACMHMCMYAAHAHV